MNDVVAGTMVQIRNVPVELHRRLKARAALEGLSMSEYVLREVTRSLERPSRAEVIQRLRSRPEIEARRRGGRGGARGTGAVRRVIVLDASAVVELLLGTARALDVVDLLEDDTQTVHAPQLLDVEVLGVLRRLSLRRRDQPGGRGRALDDYRDLGIERHDHEPLLERAWAIRDNVTAADAMYVALAEALPARLLTFDARLSNAPGLRGIVAHP